MRYLFFGTPDFASAILEKLVKTGRSPAAIVCNPDRPVGRKKIITPPPTKVLAQKYGIPTIQPEGFENFEAGGADFAVVAAYAKIIPKSVLERFPRGVIGVHPSFLPKYRGATPIQSAILAGEKETGVTLYLMDEKVDHGAVIATEKLKISDGDTYGKLENKLAELAGEMLVRTIPEFAEGRIKPEPQDENQATFTRKFSTEDARVDLEKDDPLTVERKIRALNPEPGVWTIQNGKRVKLLESIVSEGKLKLKVIQIEGEKPKNV
jgi:methionyl-tRNA formyltransferase